MEGNLQMIEENFQREVLEEEEEEDSFVGHSLNIVITAIVK